MLVTLWQQWAVRSRNSKLKLEMETEIEKRNFCTDMNAVILLTDDVLTLVVLWCALNRMLPK